MWTVLSHGLGPCTEHKKKAKWLPTSLSLLPDSRPPVMVDCTLEKSQNKPLLQAAFVLYVVTATGKVTKLPMSPYWRVLPCGMYPEYAHNPLLPGNVGRSSGAACQHCSMRLMISRGQCSMMSSTFGLFPDFMQIKSCSGLMASAKRDEFQSGLLVLLYSQAEDDRTWTILLFCLYLLYAFPKAVSLHRASALWQEVNVVYCRHDRMRL